MSIAGLKPRLLHFGPRAAVGTTIGQNGKRLPSGHDSPGIGDQELPSLLAKSFRGEPPIRAGPGWNGDNGPQEGGYLPRGDGSACPGPEPGYQSESRSFLAYLEAVAGVRHHIDITGRAMVGITTYDAATEAGADASKFWCMARCDVL